MTSNLFRGTWRIVWMELWKQDYVDMEVPGYITFEKDGNGEFQFGLLSGEIDYRLDGHRAEFTWTGVDEMDEESGSGHAEIVHGELLGHFHIHRGDTSAFRAIKAK